MRKMRVMRAIAGMLVGGIVFQSSCSLDAQAFAYQAFNSLLPVLVSALTNQVANSANGANGGTVNNNTNSSSNSNDNSSGGTP